MPIIIIGLYCFIFWRVNYINPCVASTKNIRMGWNRSTIWMCMKYTNQIQFVTLIKMCCTLQYLKKLILIRYVMSCLIFITYIKRAGTRTVAAGSIGVTKTVENVRISTDSHAFYRFRFLTFSHVFSRFFAFSQVFSRFSHVLCTRFISGKSGFEYRFV